MLRFLTLALAFASLHAPRAAAQPSDPSFIGVDHFTYGGAGCSAGTVAYDLSPDREAVTLLFSNYDVATDAVATKACAVDFALKVPPGWQYALFSIDTRGFADLAAGTSGYRAASYRFNGGSVQSLGLARLAGPFDDNYFDHGEINLATNNWSPCNASVADLTLFLQIGVSGPAGVPALMTIDSSDGSVTHQLGIRWRHCPSTDLSRRFVESLYADVLGRWAADAEINGWLNALVHGQGRQVMAKSFLTSPEHRSHEVLDGYTSLLGRLPSPQDVQTWTGWVTQRGGSSDGLTAALAGSPEFYAHWGNSPQGFVAGLYVTLLGRTASPAEVNAWLPAARVNRANVVQAILKSPEARVRLVARWYQRYLQRPGSPAEWQTWAAHMTGGNAQEDVQAGLMSSQEYLTMPR